MGFEDTMVDEQFDQETELEDSLTETDLVEEEEEPEEESLDSLTGDDETQAEEQDDSQGTSEPGYVQRRISKALAKAEERFQAQIEAMEAKYAPLQERLLEMDAQDLVRKGVVKDIEVARELVRYRQGQGASAPEKAAPEAEQPRQQNGQFAPKQDPATSTRIDMLAYQADKIKAQTGLDVVDIFSNNEEIKDAVISGEMDFYDVAEKMKAQARKKPPAPMRSPNGVNGQIKGTIMSMTDEQFEKLEKRVREGARFRE